MMFFAAAMPPLLIYAARFDYADASLHAYAAVDAADYADYFYFTLTLSPLLSIHYLQQRCLLFRYCHYIRYC